LQAWLHDETQDEGQDAVGILQKLLLLQHPLATLTSLCIFAEVFSGLSLGWHLDQRMNAQMTPVRWCLRRLVNLSMRRTKLLHQLQSADDSPPHLKLRTSGSKMMNLAFDGSRMKWGHKKCL
jgi:hypothetical protein